MKYLEYALIAAVAALFIFLAVQKDECSGKYITFAFDDGYSDNVQALNLFEERGISATIFVTALDSFENYTLLNISQLKEFQSAGWDIESHSMTHPDLSALDSSQIENELKFSRQFLAENGVNAGIFAFPYGIYNDEIKNLSIKYYSAARTVDEGYNDLKNLDYGLKAFMILNSTSFSEMKYWIDSNPSWLIIVLHHVNGSEKYGISPENLEKLLDYAEDKSIKTMSHVLDLKCQKE